VAKKFPRIEQVHREFIQRQKMFFNATAAHGARVNVSPRDVASFRVLSSNQIAYLDLTGSGNETAAHLRADGRLTILFCSFERAPMILRLYGRGRVVSRRSREYSELLNRYFANVEPVGTRQLVVLDVDLVQESCGYGVPRYLFLGERPTLTRWAEAKTPEQIEQYRRDVNTCSLDGLPTGLLEDDNP
jgi:hypothetical protein